MRFFSLLTILVLYLLFAVVFFDIPFVVVESAESFNHRVEEIFIRIRQDDGSGKLNVLFSGNNNSVINSVEIIAHFQSRVGVVVQIGTSPGEFAPVVVAVELRLEQFSSGVEVTEYLLIAALRQFCDDPEVLDFVRDTETVPDGVFSGRSGFAQCGER